MSPTSSASEYPWRGSRYRRHTAHHRRNDPPFLAGLDLSPGQALVDIGCGDGAVTASLADRFAGCTFLGIDASADMITAASEHRRENLRFEVVRAQDIGYVDRFDVAISIAALHWVPAGDHPDVLRRIRRSLRSNGRFYAEFGGAGNVARTHAAILRVARSQPFAQAIGDVVSPWYFPEADDYAGLVESAGFTVVESALVVQERRFSLEELEGWLLTQVVLPWTARLGPAAAVRFTERVVGAAAEDLTGGAGTYEEVFHRVRVSAVRS